MDELVSIIIAVYNGEKYISRAIQSCLDQKYKNIEVLVINDGSTDNTESIVKKINDQRVRYFYHENSERSFSRNRGLELSKGNYIQFLDADDILLSNKIFNDMEIISTQKVEAVFSRTLYIGSDYTKVSKYIKENRIFKTLGIKNVAPIQSVLFKKDFTRFNECISYYEDWDFWLNRLSKVKKVRSLNKVESCVFIHDNNTSHNSYKLNKGKFYVLIMNKNISSSFIITYNKYKIAKELGLNEYSNILIRNIMKTNIFLYILLRLKCLIYK